MAAKKALLGETVVVVNAEQAFISGRKDQVLEKYFKKLEIGQIAVDAIYTPVRRVGYSVENVRVGQITNYEKLTLDVETDGSLTPLQAVQQASQVLIDHFTVVVSQALPEVTAFAAEAEEAEAPEEEAEAKAGKKRGRPKKESS